MVTLYLYCLSCYHIHAVFVCLHPLMDLICINSRTALVKGENGHVLRSYTVAYILSVRAINYCINKNWPRAQARAKQHCTAVHALCSQSRQTSSWRGLRERLSPNHYMEFHLLLLEFEQTHAYNFIKVTILQHAGVWGSVVVKAQHY